MSEFGRWVLIAGYDMQAPGTVYMKNRKGRKQAHKVARILRKMVQAMSNGDRE